MTDDERTDREHIPDSTTLYFLLMKLRGGGQIVSGRDCTADEIERARLMGRLYVDRDGYAYVYRPPNVAPRRPPG